MKTSVGAKWFAEVNFNLRRDGHYAPRKAFCAAPPLLRRRLGACSDTVRNAVCRFVAHDDATDGMGTTHPQYTFVASLQ